MPAAVYEHRILDNRIVDKVCSVVLWNIAGIAAACSGSILPAVRFVGRKSPVSRKLPGRHVFLTVGRAISLRERFLRTDALTGGQV